MEVWKILPGLGSRECRTLDPREDDDPTPAKPAGGAGLTYDYCEPRRKIHDGSIDQPHARH
jgi:hypothetical protein